MVKSWIMVVGSNVLIKAAVTVFICSLLGGACQHRSKNTVSVADSPTDTDFQKDTIADPHHFLPVFGDSVNRAFFWDEESNLDQTQAGTIRVDGLTVLYIEKAPIPFVLHTSLMDIEILKLPLLLQIDAFDREAGQSLELFSGALKVEKNYESSFPSLDTLYAGDLYMINKDIDLSEKEHLDNFALLHWWESYSKSHR